MGGSMVTCDGTAGKITDINNGTIVPNQKTQLTGVVVMSQKFLVTKTSNGGCIFGVYVSEPGLKETGPGTGMLVESFGNDAVVPDGGTKAFCPRIGQDPTGDAIPDDAKPGDVVDLFGEVKSFLLPACAMQMGGTTVPELQLLVDAACSIKKTGMATPPTPHVLTSAEVAKLGDQNDKDIHGKWGNVKVAIDNEKPILDATNNVLLDMFGAFQLANGNVPVGDNIYYRGYQKAANVCHAAPTWAADPNFVFKHIEGFNTLGFCTWEIQPNDKCSDFDPLSTDCMGKTCPGG
jgi:hypothetical protein